MFLDGLLHSALPTILVSCKCDNPENTRQVNVEKVESRWAASVETAKTASNVPESARLCISSMLRTVLANRSGQNCKSYNTSL